MVKVIFYNLLRSKYKVKEEEVNANTINEIIEEVMSNYPQMHYEDFKSAVVFYKGKPYHFYQFDKVIEDGETIIITHFVGGG